MNYQIVCLIFLTYFSTVIAQNVKIQGEICNQNTNESIPNVNIYLSDRSVGTISDIQGRFLIEVSDKKLDLKLIFEHIGFETLVLSPNNMPDNKPIYLKPKSLKSEAIDVEAKRIDMGIIKDLPQPIKVITKDEYEIRGYTDVGDLLSTDQSIQINEETSGKKTLTLRAGNADDVLVLLNGIKLNSVYDNIFDLSLLNLENVERIEIIRGSLTALYGSDGFSGIINIIPDMYKKYNIKFQQRFGTYNSADWNLDLNYDFWNRAIVSYAYKKGSSIRKYIDNPAGNNLLENAMDQHTLNAIINLNKNNLKNPNHIDISYLNTEQVFQDQRFNETMSDLNQMYLISFEGNLPVLKNVKVSGAYQRLNSEQGLQSYSAYYDRKTSSEKYNFIEENSITYKRLELSTAYQFEQTFLDFKNERQIEGEESSDISRAEYFQNKHGIASILKIHAPTTDNFFNKFDVDGSYRWDYVRNYDNKIIYPDDYSGSIFPGDNRWQESTFKFSTQLSGRNDFYRFNSYLNFGNNVKFPSLLQQLSTPRQINEGRASTDPNLNPEKNLAVELSASLSREKLSLTAVDYWQVSLNYFKNEYENKFRMYRVPYNPITFYDNIQTASISGIDFNARASLYSNLLNFEFGTSKYDVSARAAFPFKYDMKNVFNAEFAYAKFNLKFNLFREGEQSGVIRTADGLFQEIVLPPYSNINIHLSKRFSHKRFKLFMNASARNILDSEESIEGIAIRDRRYYLTFGLQY